jgi:hypothetical protein
MNNKPPESNIILYQTEDGRTKIQCRFEDETVWLTQALIAELFQVSPQNITLHLKAIYSEGELDEQATCKEYLQVRSEGARSVSRALKHYSLSVILAIGYRVRSHRGTQFRQWATSRLNEYLVKGFTMDDDGSFRKLLFGLTIEACLTRKTRGVYSHLLDGEQEAHLIALACSKPPEDRARWALRLLSSRLVELGVVIELHF